MFFIIVPLLDDFLCNGYRHYDYHGDRTLRALQLADHRLRGYLANVDSRGLPYALTNRLEPCPDDLLLVKVFNVVASLLHSRDKS